MSSATHRARILITLAALLGLVTLAVPCVAVPAGGANSVDDVVVGRNIKGPYTLTWTDIDPASVTVIFNGRTLKKGENYNIDTAKGMISFTSVVLNDAIVRVCYNIIPGKSKQNAGKVNVPVTLNVFQRQDASLQVTGLYAQDDPKNPNATKTVVGLGGEKKWAQSSISSQFFVSQRNDDKSNGQTGSAWDKSAFRIGTLTDTGRLKFSGSMVHAGGEFQGGKETGLGSGKDTTSLAMDYSAGKRVQFSAGMQRTEDTAGKDKGNQSTVLQQTMVASPTDSTTVALTHSTTETSTASGSGTTVDSSGVKVDQGFGGNTKATVSFENANIASGEKTDQVQTTQAHISTAPVKQVSVDVNVVQKDSAQQGKLSQQNVSTVIKPIEQVAVTAAHSITETADSEKTATNVNLTATPLKNTELVGSVALRTDNQNQQFQRDLRVVTKPVEFAKFTAGFSQRGINEDDDVTKSAAVELSPLSNLQISAGYTYAESGAQIMTIRDYAATTKPWGFFSISGSVRDREVVNDSALDSKSMQVALSPLNLFTLTGGYQSNPEDKKGQIQTYNATNVGMQMRLGSVGVSTGYSSKDEYMVRRMSDERRIGFDVPMFRNGKLITGVKIARMLDGSEYSTRTYSLGFSHSVGQAFSLSLTGYYTNYMHNNVSMPEKDEYSAEASLGLKF